MAWGKDLAKWFSNACALPVAEDEQPTVIYGGPAKPSPGTTPADFEFEAYLPGKNAAVYVPAITSNPEVIAQLKAMKPGQSFTVTEEENWGGLGARINAIKIEKDARVYTMPAHAGPMIKI